MWIVPHFSNLIQLQNCLMVLFSFFTSFLTCRRSRKSWNNHRRKRIQNEIMLWEAIPMSTSENWVLLVHATHTEETRKTGCIRFRSILLHAFQSCPSNEGNLNLTQFFIRIFNFHLSAFLIIIDVSFFRLSSMDLEVVEISHRVPIYVKRIFDAATTIS